MAPDTLPAHPVQIGTSVTLSITVRRRPILGIPADYALGKLCAGSHVGSKTQVVHKFVGQVFANLLRPRRGAPRPRALGRRAAGGG